MCVCMCIINERFRRKCASVCVYVCMCVFSENGTHAQGPHVASQVTYSIDDHPCFPWRAVNNIQKRALC